jgi:hypothetical protein
MWLAVRLLFFTRGASPLHDGIGRERRSRPRHYSRREQLRTLIAQPLLQPLGGRPRDRRRAALDSGNRWPTLDRSRETPT